MSAENRLLVNDGLTAIIVETLNVQRSEEYYPGNDPDRMDNKITACKKRAELLREMRNLFEDEMSKPL